MATYTYPKTSTLIKVAQNLIPSMTMDDPIFKLFPIKNQNASRIRWEIKDNFGGLMKLRGLGGEPTGMSRVGSNVYEALPGYYGQFGSLDEEELTTRAQNLENMEVNIPVTDMISELQEQLMILQINRARQLTWALAIAGTFSIPLPNGGIGHSGSYTVQSANLSTWDDFANATPMADLLGLQVAYGRGTSTSFMAGSEVWMNSKTANDAMNNRNANDLGGRLVAGGETINDLAGVNRILLARNSPTINVYDDGYINDSGVFTLFIPDDVIMVVGKRPSGDTPGNFIMTKHAINGGGIGAYTDVIDMTSGPMRKIPPKIEVHGGFHGGPVMVRPSQLIIGDVS